MSIRRRLGLYWLSMATAVLAAILLVLSFTGVFSSAPRRLQSALTMQQQNMRVSVSGHMSALEASCISLSSELSRCIGEFLEAEGADFEDFNDNPKLIASLQSELYAPLCAGLRSSESSGIFFVLDATCNTAAPGSESSRMGVYLRYSDLSGVNTADKHLVYFRGSAELARAEKIQMHNRWNLEFDTNYFPGFADALSRPVERLEGSCRWTEKLNMKDTWENAVLVYVPIIDEKGTTVGLCGLEVSELYFRLSYPAAESPYGSMILALMPVERNTLYLDKAMLGASGDTFIQTLGAFTAKEGRYYNIYSNGSDEYLGLHFILPARVNTSRSLAAVTLVSETNYKSSLRHEKAVWALGLLGIIAAMLIISRILTRQVTAPISKLLDAVKNDTPSPDRPTSGISEIDEIMECILSRRTDPSGSSALPPNVEALLGDFTSRVETLTPMERRVLQYYIEGFSIEDVAADSFISINTAKKHNTNINHKLGVKSREELMLYIDLFRRCGRIDLISYHG